MTIGIISEPEQIIRDNKKKSIDFVDLQKNLCLTGSLIKHAIRSVLSSDECVIGDDKGNITGWCIPLHVYFRVIEPFIYRMKPRYFFTPYTYYKDQIFCGVVTGPLLGGGVVALITATCLGLCAPWFLLGAACISSLVYLVSGVKAFGKGFCHLFNSKHPKHLLQAKMAFQEGIGCLLIALLIPIASIITFPIELVRFITRCVSTVIEIAKQCLLDLHLKNQGDSGIVLTA